MATTAGKIHLFLQEDMDARAKVAEAYRPDLFIDLHYDSQLTDRLQSARDDVSVYVPGAVGATETGAKNQRADALKHLLEVRRWKQSAKAAKAMVESLAGSLGLPLLKDGEPGTMVRVSDGVFARNIFETKRATSGISAFFESFHYDHTREFPRLTTLDRQSAYRGKTFRYPSRLDAVATGIRDGLVRYFRDFSIEE
jgi:N-acetylmuramoyl-L-alanine amidase